jgi:hypothetical protein
VSIDPIQDPADQLLQALSVGDLDPQDPRVIARFAAEPDLATRWEEIAATLAVLRSLDGGPEPESGPAPEVRRLDTMAAIRSFWRESPRTAWSWRRLLPVVALVAAALFVVWWLLPPTTPPTDPVLGGPGTQLRLAPNDEKWEAGPLTWTAVRGADRYRLLLEPAPPFELASLPGTEWQPSTDQRAQLPRRFRWRVIAFAGEVEVATSVWAETWR